MNTVYRKTAKGIAEIETRAHRLVPRLRGALILIDGRRSDDELAGMIANDPAGALASLFGDGFIEVLATLASPSPATRPGALDVPAAAPSRRDNSSSTAFETLRRDAARALTDQLGPHAETIALKIERSKNLPELQALLAQGVQILKSLRGHALAEAFAARFIGQTPP